MITHPDELRDGRFEWTDPLDAEASRRLAALPSLIDRTALDTSDAEARSVERSVWVAIGLFFIPVIGTLALLVWCVTLIRDAANGIHCPVVRMAETPEGAELIRRGDELRRLLSQRSSDADADEWGRLVSEAESLHLEQQLLLARFRP